MKTARHQLPPTPVRIPPDFKALLRAEARANERSLNGEILARLRSTFDSKRNTVSQKKGPTQ